MSRWVVKAGDGGKFRIEARAAVSRGSRAYRDGVRGPDTARKKVVATETAYHTSDHRRDETGSAQQKSSAHGDSCRWGGILGEIRAVTV
jgi:hypothetical protein